MAVTNTIRMRIFYTMSTFIKSQKAPLICLLYFYNNAFSPILLDICCGVKTFGHTDKKI